MQTSRPALSLAPGLVVVIATLVYASAGRPASASDRSGSIEPALVQPVQRDQVSGRTSHEVEQMIRDQVAAYEGVQKSLAELGVLQSPLPSPGKYYDMTYVEQAHQTARR